jgi:hypothetical protein
MLSDMTLLPVYSLNIISAMGENPAKVVGIPLNIAA